MSNEQSSGPNGHIEAIHDDGKYLLRLVDPAGAELLTGGPFPTLTEVLGAIARLRDTDAVWRARMTATGEYYFCVMDDRDQVLGTSAMYVAPADRDRSLADAREIVPGAALVVHGMDRPA